MSMFESLANLMRTLAAEGVLPRAIAQARIEPAATIQALGLDSVGMLDFLFALEERLGIYIPYDLVDPDMTLQALATLAEQRKAV